MPTPQSRLDRINEQVQRELALLLPTVKDPRVSGLMITVLHCEVTNDLRWCKVHLSVLQSYDPKQLRQGLKSCQGYLRSELGRALSLRYTPELTFVLDDSIAYGAKIAQTLNTLDIKPETPEDDSIL